MIRSEIDEAIRQTRLDEAAAIVQDGRVHVLLPVQPLPWGLRRVEIGQAGKAIAARRSRGRRAAHEQGTPLQWA